MRFTLGAARFILIMKAGVVIFDKYMKMRVNRLSKLNIPTSEENYTLGFVNNSLKTGKKRVNRWK